MITIESCLASRYFFCFQMLLTLFSIIVLGFNEVNEQDQRKFDYTRSEFLIIEIFGKRM